LEAEVLDNPGGWVVDPNSFNRWSPYFDVMAWANLKKCNLTVVNFPETGNTTYGFRTMKLGARRSGKPPVVPLKVDETHIGKGSCENVPCGWNMRTAQIKANLEKKLNDRFEVIGRCDAIYFSRENANRPSLSEKISRVRARTSTENPMYQSKANLMNLW